MKTWKEVSFTKAVFQKVQIIGRNYFELNEIEFLKRKSEPVVQKNNLVTWPIYYTADKILYQSMWTEEGKNGVQRKNYAVNK